MMAVQSAPSKFHRKKKEIPLVKTILKKSANSKNVKIRSLFKPTNNRREVEEQLKTSLQGEETSGQEEEMMCLQGEDYSRLAETSLIPTVLYGRLVKKPAQLDQIVRPGDRHDGDTTWDVFEDVLTEASDKMSETSKTSNVPFVKKTGQQDGPYDLEPLVTHIGQIIDAGEYDKFSPPGGGVTHRQKLNHAMGFFRKARLSFTKLRFVDLMVNCDVYVSALIQVAGQGMLRSPLIVARCRQYLRDANLNVVDPLPP